MRKLQATWEQCGANRIITVVDIVTVLINAAIVVDIGSIVLIIAGRPQPPPAENPVQSNPRITSRRMIIFFCHCSSMHRANFGNRRFAGRSAHTALVEYNLAPWIGVQYIQAVSDPSLPFFA